jgi:hypothetical protein
MGGEYMKFYTLRNIFFLYKKYKNTHPIAVMAIPFRKGAHISGKSSIIPPKKNLEA